MTLLKKTSAQENNPWMLLIFLKCLWSDHGI